MHRKRATIREIAEAAGVSIGTVSRALKGQPGLSEQTRDHVLKTSKSLRYDTRRLRNSKPNRVLVVSSRALIEDALGNHFYARVLHGAEKACSEENVAFSLLSIASHEDISRHILRQEADALLVLGHFERDALAAMRDCDVPMVIALDSNPLFRCVRDDDFLGGLLATRHLIEAGARRPALITGPHVHGTFEQRAKGFRSALYDAQIPADPNLEIRLDGALGYDDACCAAMRQLLALPEPPDAVFAYNDDSALHAIAVCLAAGLRVPEDIRIVGYDDVAIAARSQPSLTTIRVDKEALGRTAAMALIEGNTEPGELLLPVELVVRESSVAPPQSSRARVGASTSVQNRRRAY